MRIKEDRNLVTYIILTIVTCGIYGFYFLYKMAEDTNIMCEGDGQRTSGVIKFIVLTYITCGIYGIYWYYAVGNRLAAAAPRYGLQF